eukprot:CAMPEP_0177640986 /NCGR_PEP_ID=MMETSP0447-20121125/6833_1 /TAXON_ID=0 /ORGANISM="Stygamoeba regulata, Strain BSH-02190019" /LENGTH=81 /DNA_ID=CAMNT_0019143089 /DNA_START=34 /DNA_END=279 /DNA_ORIENTATION=+
MTHTEIPTKAVTREEMKAARLPQAFRDSCAHILIPLDQCRKDCFWLPWKCTDLRHAYEKCQYEDYLRRVQEKLELQKTQVE